MFPVNSEGNTSEWNSCHRYQWTDSQFVICFDNEHLSFDLTKVKFFRTDHRLDTRKIVIVITKLQILIFFQVYHATSLANFPVCDVK